MEPTILLLTFMQVPPRIEEEFNAWYDTEHIDERLSVKGFLSGRRFRALDELPAPYLTLYDVENEAVFNDERYKFLRAAGVTPWTVRMRSYFFNPNFVRGVYRRAWPNPQVLTPREAGGVLFAAFEVGEKNRDEFTRWYDQEYLPTVLKLPGFLRARRFEAIDAKPNQLTIFDLKDVNVARSGAFDEIQKAAANQKYWAMTSDNLNRLFVSLYSDYAEQAAV